MRAPVRWVARAAACTLLLAGTPAVGADFYPKQISLRTFGTNQGDVGDCQTAAEVGALESAFANRGLGFVKLSLFYRHAANWASGNIQPVEKLSLDDADRALIQKAGPLLPDYMWPEDGEGYNPYRTGVRPHPAQAVIWDADFPNAGSLAFSAPRYVFEPGWANSGTLDSLKATVAAGNAVVLSLHSALFQPGDPKIEWDHVTGFLKTPYSWANLVERLTQDGHDPKTGIDHAMMVVGFDDTLYAGQYPVPGALIVRNSWNDGAEVSAALANPTPDQLAQLPKMRLRVYGQNLPGFYALPYQYIVDLLANHTGNYEVLNLDYSTFAAKYAALSLRYQTELAPFVCDEALTPKYRLSDPVKRAVATFGAAFKTMSDPSKADAVRANASRKTYLTALRELQSRNLDHPLGSGPLFLYARLAHHVSQKVDRADDFYSGKFRDYYCPDSTDIWPSLTEINGADVRAVLGALGDGGSTFPNWYEFLRALSETGN